MCLEGGLVGEILALDFIRIKVVVHVDGIDVVPLHHVAHHAVEPGACLVQAGVEVPGVAVAHEEVLVLEEWMFLGEVARAARLGHAVGVEPHVYLHEAAVRLVDDELQGVVVRFGTLALLAREPVGPRFVGRQVEGVGRGTYLQYHRVDVVACQAVEQAEHLVLLLGSTQPAAAGPVDVGYGGYPHGSHFAFGLRGLHGLDARQQAEDN